MCLGHVPPYPPTWVGPRDPNLSAWIVYRNAAAYAVVWAANAQDAQEEAEELCADLYEDELLTVIEVDDPARPYLLDAARNLGAYAAWELAGDEP